MSQREAFEAWAKDYLFNPDIKDEAWEAWQAAQAAQPVEPVATMWREKNIKLYPGILWKLTDAGKALPTGVSYKLYTTPPDQTAELERLRLNEQILQKLHDDDGVEIARLRDAVKLGVEALEESRDDVAFCIEQNKQLAGYDRYDKRIAFYTEQLARHDDAIVKMREGSI